MALTQEHPEIVHAGIDSLTSDWPDALKAEDPGRETTTNQRCSWYEKHKDHDPEEWADEEPEDESEERPEDPEEEPSAEESSEAPTPDEAPDKEYRFQETTDAGW